MPDDKPAFSGLFLSPPSPSLPAIALATAGHQKTAPKFSLKFTPNGLPRTDPAFPRGRLRFSSLLMA